MSNERPRSHTLAPQVSRNGGEEHTGTHKMQPHVEKERTRSGIKEGGNEEKRGEMEW